MPDLSWELFERQVSQCQMCGLCQNIHHKVPGQGDHHSPLMLIGEGPGQVEDEEGLAFVGPAGQLLTKMLAAISLPRDRVYICNVVKCRPPQNRVPTDEEAAACKLHLRIQTALIRPKVIVLLGSTAAKNIIGADIRITRDRGKWFERKGIWMMATYHPSARPVEEARRMGGHAVPARSADGFGTVQRHLSGADTMSETIKPGRYRHFKGKEYEVLYIATHSETREKMVVYRALYGERGVWVRPASMWNEVIERDGKTYRRFTYIGEGDA